MTELVVAVDGPAGSGKSSVSRRVAKELRFGYLDTGAMYRAVAWHALETGRDTADAEAVIAAWDDARIDLSLDPGDPWVRVGDRDVTTAIREPRVSAAVSGVARVVPVREAINERFRALMDECACEGIVVEGRDITTVVAPDAPVRVLLTADAEVRAARRSAELPVHQRDGVAEAIERRDASDGKVVDFLTPAEGVEVVDSTDLDFDQTVAAILALVHAAPGSTS
ncbi:(d)CMP kinase [Microbacterium sp. X-17]|uniref:(d)CMP kinase n=1 Tax=Microbacterium sp. X-17 TaxID=3144404 RepID=UPI0031F4F955